MNRKNLFLVALAATCCFFSCKKNVKKDSDPQVEERVTYDLDPEGVVFWDSQESIDIQPHDVILQDGQRLDEFLAELGDGGYIKRENGLRRNAATREFGPQEARKELIANLTKSAIELTDDKNFDYPDQGPNKPKQYGLAYSWGQRNYKIRQTPPGKGNKCPAEVYGLDCSGFLYNIFKMSGIEISSGTAESQRQPKGLGAAIKNAYPKLTKVKVEDLGKLVEGDMKVGDIIYWIEKDGIAHHIGMVLEKSGIKAIAQSNGDESADCVSNYTDRRGPRFSPIAKAILPKPKKKGEIGGYGDNYSIVRINMDISGKWIFSLGCAGETNMLFNLDLDFPVTENSTFSAEQSATDYDGSTVEFNFSFTYDKETNKLDCIYTMTDKSIAGFERKDHFTANLDLGDDTGLISATNDYIHNGNGCSEVAKLVNKEKQTVTGFIKPAIHTNKIIQPVRTSMGNKK